MPKTSLPFSLRPLDKKFVGPKPINEAPLDVIANLESAGRLLMERKRQGHCIFAPVTSLHGQCVELYSSGINALTEKLPHIAEQLRGMNIPSDTLLAGEGVLAVKGIDSDSTFGRVARSSPANALALQKDLDPVHLALFNVIVYKGKPVIHLPYEDRLDILLELTARQPMENVGVVQVIDTSFEKARGLVEEHGWEGLVLYDKKAGSAYRLGDGADHPRPEGCWKWKPLDEDDFVATGWIQSTSAKFKGLVKDLLIAQYDANTRELVSWGKVGNGLTTEQKREYADAAKYPMVVQLEFERRTPNSRLISARIKRERFDKSPEECIYPHP